MTCALAHTYFLLPDLLVSKPSAILHSATYETSPFSKNFIDKLCSVLLHHYTVFRTLAVNISMYSITLLWHFITILLVNSLFNLIYSLKQS